MMYGPLGVPTVIWRVHFFKTRRKLHNFVCCVFGVEPRNWKLKNGSHGSSRYSTVVKLKTTMWYTVLVYCRTVISNLVQIYER